MRDSELCFLTWSSGNETCFHWVKWGHLLLCHSLPELQVAAGNFTTCWVKPSPSSWLPVLAISFPSQIPWLYVQDSMSCDYSLFSSLSEYLSL
jgi:hypothetical protein